jgi:adhesin/invasin
LANRQIVVNEQLPAPIYYMAPGQTNFQMPSNAPVGTQRIAVRVADTGELVSGGSLFVAAAGPGLFTIGQTGSGQGAATNQDFTVNSSSNPALSGSTVTLYGTGQGQVSPAVLDGQPAPSGPLSNTVAVPTSDAKTCQNNQPSVCVQVGNTFGNISYSGLAPGFIGLWQINVALPQGVTGSAVPVRVVINGTPSNTVTIAVR